MDFLTEFLLFFLIDKLFLRFLLTVLNLITHSLRPSRGSRTPSFISSLDYPSRPVGSVLSRPLRARRLGERGTRSDLVLVHLPSLLINSVFQHNVKQKESAWIEPQRLYVPSSTFPVRQIGGSVVRMFPLSKIFSTLPKYWSPWKHSGK